MQKGNNEPQELINKMKRKEQTQTLDATDAAAIGAAAGSAGAAGYYGAKLGADKIQQKLDFQQAMFEDDLADPFIYQEPPDIPEVEGGFGSPEQRKAASETSAGKRRVQTAIKPQDLFVPEIGPGGERQSGFRHHMKTPGESNPNLGKMFDYVTEGTVPLMEEFENLNDPNVVQAMDPSERSARIAALGNVLEEVAPNRTSRSEGRVGMAALEALPENYKSNRKFLADIAEIENKLGELDDRYLENYKERQTLSGAELRANIAEQDELRTQKMKLRAKLKKLAPNRKTQMRYGTSEAAQRAKMANRGLNPQGEPLTGVKKDLLDMLGADRRKAQRKAFPTMSNRDILENIDDLRNTFDDDYFALKKISEIESLYADGGPDNVKRIQFEDEYRKMVADDFGKKIEMGLDNARRYLDQRQVAKTLSRRRPEFMKGAIKSGAAAATIIPDPTDLAMLALAAPYEMMFETGIGEEPGTGTFNIPLAKTLGNASRLLDKPLDSREINEATRIRLAEDDYDLASALFNQDVLSKEAFDHVTGIRKSRGLDTTVLPEQKEQTPEPEPAMGRPGRRF